MTDKQKVRDLESITNSYNDQHLMVITDLNSNQLSKQKISDFIKDIISDEQENSVVTASDGKIFCLDTSNADNISSGTLDEARLPKSGVTEGEYQYPVDLKVNDKGQIVSVAAGQPGGNNADASLSNLNQEGEKHFLNKFQITDCILDAPNGTVEFEGSTITIKQGLKVLIPDGFNADGSLKNIEYTLEEDLSRTYTTTVKNGFLFLNLHDGILYQTWQTGNYYLIGNNKTNISNFTGVFRNLDTNLTDYYDKGVAQQGRYVCIADNVNSNNGVVSSITPYRPAELIKRSDKVEIASWSFPDSRKAVNLTLLASGQSYTQPVDGYYAISKTAGIQNAYVSMYSGGLGYACPSPNAAGSCVLSIKTLKNASCVINYNATGDVNYFRFIPAKGAVNE